jgi:hypothetical protein
MAEDAGVATTDRLVDAFGRVRIACEVVFEAESVLEPFLGTLHGRSPAEFKRAADALGILAEAEWLPVGWSTRDLAQLDRAASLLRQTVEQIDEISRLRSEFAQQVELNVEPLEVCALLAQARDQFAHWYQRLWFSEYGSWLNEVREKVHPRAEDHHALVQLAAKTDQIRLANQTLESLRPNVQGLLSDQAIWPDRAALEDASIANARAAALRRGQTRFVSAPSFAEEPHMIGAPVRAGASQLLLRVVVLTAAVDGSGAN